MIFKFTFLILLITSCANNRVHKRFPASIENDLVRIEQAKNPFDVLKVIPGTPRVEIDITTKKTIERITGWDLFTINKLVEENSLEQKIIELTEREQDSVKKVIDSRLLISEISKREKVKFSLGPLKFKLGLKELETIAIDELRHIQIYVENELGKFYITYGQLNEIPQIAKFNLPLQGLNNQTGYIITFSAVAKDAQAQAKIEVLETKLNGLRQEIAEGGNSLKKQLQIAKVAEEIGSLKSARSTDPRVMQFSEQLREELQERYKRTDTPLTKNLGRIYNKINLSTCFKAYSVN